MTLMRILLVIFAALISVRMVDFALHLMTLPSDAAFMGGITIICAIGAAWFQVARRSKFVRRIFNA